jgi:hypothetical protein
MLGSTEELIKDTGHKMLCRNHNANTIHNGSGCDTSDSHNANTTHKRLGCKLPGKDTSSLKNKL